MQLPIYLYLVKKSNLFKNVRFTGFYLQRILSNEIRFVPGKTYLSLKCDNLKLDGYSTSDVIIISLGCALIAFFAITISLICYFCRRERKRDFMKVIDSKEDQTQP